MTSKTSRYLFVCICAYISIISALTILNRLGPDRYWFSALNLYLPQVFWLIPGFILTVICLVMARRWTWAPLLCIAWIAGPIMGFCWPQHGSSQASDGALIRIMTWNAKYGKYGKYGALALTYDIDKNRPDVILFQDAPCLLNGPLGSYFQKWNTHAHGQFVVASRFPLSGVEVRSITLPWEKLTCLRCQIRVGSNNITLYNVHLESPRRGLNAIRSARKELWYMPDAIQQMESNVFTRLMQARMLKELILREKGPVIVAGDLNSPDTSMVCASLRNAGLHDAFAEGGRGYGYTYGHLLLQRKLPWMRASWMRIDHIMMSSRFETRRSWTGTGETSDHRPVIADIILKRGCPISNSN